MTTPAERFSVRQQNLSFLKSSLTSMAQRVAGQKTIRLRADGAATLALDEEGVEAFRQFLDQQFGRVAAQLRKMDDLVAEEYEDEEST